ncbi:histone H4 acetyltransferase, NuA4 complex, Eaf6 family protein [Rhodotorula toruloides]|uniref:Chromatin modification-related protein EAF6 n=1 Tax=Rhodotorula toruloides TaxID=5286 RepID=A0A511KLV1_RHOTO|nr:histone H4 acetyltransferase, NuA4 complex, Eaf6 family protein [Rhodotorula toruloides]
MSTSTATASTSTAAQPNPTAPSPNDPPKQPHPLDGLSPMDLRIKLEQSRKDLRGMLEKKRKIDRDLATLEASIYAFEGSYLSDSLFPPSSASQSSSAAAAQFGNIIRGYDSYLKAPSSASGDRKRGGRPGDNAAEKERMFSASSATYQRSIELRSAEHTASASVEPESDEDGASFRRKRSRQH